MVASKIPKIRKGICGYSSEEGVYMLLERIATGEGIFWNYTTQNRTHWFNYEGYFLPSSVLTALLSKERMTLNNTGGMTDV